MGKAPDPTPPKETSAASTGTNVSTSIANAFLNNPNEITADGTKTTDQTGEYTWTDQYTGVTHTVPRTTVTTTLSPQQQAIKAQQDAASLNLSTLGNDLSGTLGKQLKQLTGNFKLGNEATEARLAELGSKRLDPRFAQEDEALRTRLSNQGIKAGSTAYDREMGNLSQSKNDAYNQLYLQGRGQAAQESLTEDNQRINQIGALLSGGQVSQPNFLTGFQQTQIPVTNNAGIIGDYDKARITQAQVNSAGIGSILGGFGGLFAKSDARIKTDIKKVGELNGQEIHTYRMKEGGPIQMGLIAQKVEKKTPEAVMTGPDGIKRVNYNMALKMGGAIR
jgi:hypothetical protein